MGKTKIEWTDETINPIIGCSKISAGCENCYAERMAARLATMPHTKDRYAGITKGGKWTGKTKLVESELLKPLKWRKSKRVFLGSMTDLFHESVEYSDIDKILCIMSITRHITYQILTKRPDRMEDYFSTRDAPGDVAIDWLMSVVGEEAFYEKYDDFVCDYFMTEGINRPNLWLGVTAENQEQADIRIPILLKVPAAKRFVSVEPMLEEINISHYLPQYCCNGYECGCGGSVIEPPPFLDWVIVGGESGSGARPMNPDWARSIRDQCKDVGVPFFFKQMSGKAPIPATLQIKEFPK